MEYFLVMVLVVGHFVVSKVIQEHPEKNNLVCLFLDTYFTEYLVFRYPEFKKVNQPWMMQPLITTEQYMRISFLHITTARPLSE